MFDGSHYGQPGAGGKTSYFPVYDRFFRFSCKAHPAARRKQAHGYTPLWRYELYLSHMFVVLGAVALYRTLLGKEQAWTFTVYLPVLLLCFGLALVLEKFTLRFTRRGTCAAAEAERELIIQ